MEKNCGNCDYCAEVYDDLVCVNDQSEHLTDYVDENDSCDNWSRDDE